jgi:hypothetical protein
VTEFDWGGLYAHLIACTGWTWEIIDGLDLPRVEAMMKYYVDHPPLHLMVAAYLGIESKDQPAKKIDNAEFFGMLSGGVIRG